MAAGSLVVRIGANINDFSSKLNKMTKEVSQASRTLTDVGKSMTLGITLPVGLAIGALAKMAVENEAVGRKLERTFGAATAHISQQLQQMMKIVPEAETEMQKFAITTDDFAVGLGMAAPKAAQFSQSVMQIAAQLSAGKMIAYGEALDIVEKSLAGQTRGLKSVGIVIEQAQVKQEAYRLGLLKVGQELTPLGTALATYSLLTQQASRFSGEAGAQAQDTGRKLAFLKRDLTELADKTSDALIPALTVFVEIGRVVIDVLTAIPMWMRGTILAIAAFAAVVGPTIIVVAKLTEAIIALRAASTLLAASGGIAKILAVLANPAVIAGIVALGLVIGALVVAWRHFHKAVQDTPKLDPLANVKDLLKGLGGATSMSTDSPLEALKKRANALTRGLELAVDAGTPLIDAQTRLRDMAKEALDIYAQQADKFGEMALAAREIVLQLRRAASFEFVATFANRSMPGQTFASGIRDASFAAASNASLSRQAVTQLINNETSLRLREILVGMPNAFNATRVAAIEMGEGFRRASDNFRVELAKFKTSWSSAASIGKSLKAGFEDAASSMLADFTPAGLAAQALGKVLEGLQPVLETLMVPLVELGKIIGIMLTPVLKILFPVLKYFGIATALVGEVIARVVAGLATAVGKLFVGIGNLLNKVPFLHLGDPVKKLGEGILRFADEQYETADQLKRARKELSEMSWDDAAGGVNKLAEAARDAAEELTNLPQAFKVQLARWRATLPIGNEPNVPVPHGWPAGGQFMPIAPTPAGGWTTGAGGAGLGGFTPGSGALDDRTPLNINLDGKTIAQTTLGLLRLAAQRQYGDASRINDVTSVR